MIQAMGRGKPAPTPNGMSAIISQRPFVCLTFYCFKTSPLPRHERLRKMNDRNWRPRKQPANEGGF
jgi:hypothetical protein